MPAPSAPMKVRAPSLKMPVSTDTLLGGRVSIRQPVGGYRTAIDPVLLAAAVAAKAGEAVLDAGCGTGAASLCLAARVAGVQIFGLDAEPEFISLARESAELSGFQPAPIFEVADLMDFAETSGRQGAFDQVMTNPPYRTAASGNPPKHRLKRAAHVEGRVALAEWIGHCFALLRPGGGFTMIYSHDRLLEVRSLIEARAARAVIHPLWPKRQNQDKGQGAKRFIIQAINTPPKGAGEVRVSDGLVLHRADGSFSAAAGRILKGGEALPPLAQAPQSDLS